MAEELKLTVIADTHYYSRKLGYTGRAYELRSDSDQKCLAETSDIVDAAFRKIASSDTDAVLIAGDLSNDGERISHEEFREKLRELAKSKPVYVITATHDWCCDGNPRRFDGDNVYHDVDVLSPEELRDFYCEFGPRQAVSEYFTHLGTSSYAIDLSDNVRLLALNDDQSGQGGAGFSEEHFRWIEKQLSDAKDKGMAVIGMQHHLLLRHVHPMISGGGMSVRDDEYVAARLADAGLKYSFVGHSHMTDVARITTPSGNTLSEVNVGSLCGYPAPMCIVTVEDGGITVDMEYLDSFEGAPDAQEFLKEHALNLINKVVDGVANGDKRDYVDRITALQANGEKLLPFRFILKPAAGLLSEAKVKTACTVLNALTFGKIIDVKSARPFADERVIDIAGQVFLNIFDGGRNTYPPDSDFYRLVTSVLSIPSRVLKGNKAMNQINELAHILVAGNELNKFPVKL